MQYYAYAKINLRLEIIKKFANGYHDLRMLNAKISLKDILDIDLSNENQVTYSVESLNHLENNLCLNVLNELTDIYNIKERYHIHITKNIPQGAGLGGGSSDVAAIINFIDEKYNLKLTLDDKIQVGLKYGADVPYCLINDLAYVSGIGENITILKERLNIEKLVIVNPNIHISTKEAFSQVQKYSSETSIDQIRIYIKEGRLNSLLYNELEKATFQMSEELKNLKKSLTQYGNVIMSGSGSTMLVFLNQGLTASDIKKEYPTYLVEEVDILNQN